MTDRSAWWTTPADGPGGPLPGDLLRGGSGDLPRGGSGDLPPGAEDRSLDVTSELPRVPQARVQLPLPLPPANDDLAPRHPLRHPVVPLIGVAVTSALVGSLVAVLNAHPAPPPPAPSPTVSPVPVPRAAITARSSSEQTPQGGSTYSADNTLDGDLATAWNSNGKVDGKGPGLTLTYTFKDPVDLHTITVRNGYQKTLPGLGRDRDLYAVNERVHELKVTTDVGTWTWSLEDSRAAQTFTQAGGRTRTVQFTVQSVYSSDRYTDLALSEVSFTALPG